MKATVKKCFVILMFVAMTSVSAMGQYGLNVRRVFTDKYTKLPNAVVTYVAGDKVEKYKLDVYRSLSLTCDTKTAYEIEHLVLTDGATATDKEVAYRDGHLRYGFYVLPKDIDNRYLFYVGKKLGAEQVKVTVIYMSGSATKLQVLKMMK